MRNGLRWMESGALLGSCLVWEVIKQPYGGVRKALDRAVLWKENEGQIRLKNLLRLTYGRA